MPLFILTENGLIDDVSVRQSHFDRMFVIVNLLDVNGNRLISEHNVTGFVQRGTEREGTVLGPILQRDVLPHHREGFAYCITLMNVVVL